MVTWKQIFGPNFSVAQIETLLLAGAFSFICLGFIWIANLLLDCFFFFVPSIKFTRWLAELSQLGMKLKR